MNEINQTNSNIFSQLGIAQTGSSEKKELGQDEFLELLVAQMQNQNPMEPQTNGEFLAQMAQFGTVDGVQNLQNSFDSLASSLQSNQALQASALVGRSVLVPTNTGVLGSEGTVSGQFNVPSSASNVQVSVYNEQGEIVKTIDMGTTAAGDADFTWDGTTNTGERASAGNYTLRAEGTIGNQNTSFTTYLNANVNSVALGNDGSGITLNVAGVGTMTLDQIKAIK